MYSQKRNGKVRFFESYLDPVSMKRRTLSVTMEKGGPRAKREAQKKLDLKASLLFSRPLPRLSFGELCDAYIEEKKKEVKMNVFREQSLRSVSCSLRCLASVIGTNVPVSSLTPELIKQKIEAEPGAMVSTKNGRIKLARTVVRFAFKNGFIDRDFAGSISYIKKTDAEKFAFDPSSRFLEPEEYNALLSVIDDEAERDLTEFLLLSGCRIGEALGLELCHVDFKNKKIHIVQTYGAGTRKMGLPKRPASKRSIYMQPELTSLMIKIITRNEKTRARVFDTGSLVFVDSSSALPIIYEHYYRHLKRYAMKAKINKNVTPHMLRRTHASVLYSNGLNKDQIAARLGHRPGSEDAVTMAVYIYINRKREQVDSAALEKINFF